MNLPENVMRHAEVFLARIRTLARGPESSRLLREEVPRKRSSGGSKDASDKVLKKLLSITRRSIANTLNLRQTNPWLALRRRSGHLS